MDFLKNMSDHTKGIVLILMGTVLLLHTLGIICIGLRYIIILFSLGMIGCGFLMARTKLTALFSKKDQL